MAMFELIKEEKATSVLVDYIFDEGKMLNDCYGGTGIALQNPSGSMYAMNRVYGHTSKRIKAYHAKLTFSQEELQKLTEENIMKIAYDICLYYGNVQVFFVVHKGNCTDGWDSLDDQYIHIHFIFNTVNMKNGEEFQFDFNEKYGLVGYLEYILSGYGITNDIIVNID